MGHLRFSSKTLILVISTSRSISRLGRLTADNTSYTAIVNELERGEEIGKKLVGRGDIWLGSLGLVHGKRKVRLMAEEVYTRFLPVVYD